MESAARFGVDWRQYVPTLSEAERALALAFEQIKGTEDAKRQIIF